MDELPKSVADRLAHLRDSRNLHLEIGERLMRADEGRLFGIDLIAFAVLHRSLALIEGFALLVEHRNPLSAIPLVRLQVDTMLRFFASSLVDDPNQVLKLLLEGTPLNRLQSRDGKPLSDSYLAAEADNIFSGTKSVYEETCGFVHLSTAHMTNPVVAVGEDRRMEFAIGAGREWTEKEMRDTVNAFIRATETLMHVCGSWLSQKERVAATRPAPGG